MNTKGQTLKVIELGIQDRVLNALKSPTFSAEALARELQSDGINITAHSLRKYIKKSKKAQQEMIQSDLQQANQFIQLTMNYQKALKDILDEVEIVKNMAKDQKDYTTYNQLVGRLMQGIELIAKLTGDIKPKGSVDIKIIYNEINSDIEKEMKTLKSDILHSNIVDVDYEIEQEDKMVAKKIRGEDI